MPELNNEYKVIFSKESYDKIMWLTKNYDKEISAWVTGEIDKEQVYIKELLFPEQEISSVSVDTDESQLVKLRKEYGDKCKEIIGHWHSHHNMGSHWSSTDEDFMDKHMDQRELRFFFVSSVSDNILCRMYMNDKVKLKIDNIEVLVEEFESDYEEELKAIIKEKVKEKKENISNMNGNSYDLTYEELPRMKVTKEGDLVVSRCNGEIYAKVICEQPYKFKIMDGKQGIYNVFFNLKDKVKAEQLLEDIEMDINEFYDRIEAEECEGMDEYQKYKNKYKEYYGGWNNGFY